MAGKHDYVRPLSCLTERGLVSLKSGLIRDFVSLNLVCGVHEDLGAIVMADEAAVNILEEI